MRSKICGGGPSIDSKVTVVPALALANELLALPPPAQPPRPQESANKMAAAAARGVRQQARL
jgi:hypothetical protein